MFALTELINRFFDFLLYSLVMPVLKTMVWLLDSLLLPLNGFTPVVQVLAVSLVAAFISWWLGGRFKTRGEERLQGAFKEKMESLKYTTMIEDSTTERAVRQGINDSADRVYEELIMDKFFNMGLTYFMPMFVFLIWLDYSVFTPDTLVRLTGAPYLLSLKSGQPLGTATTYLIFFNVSLLGLRILSLGLKKILEKAQ